MIRALPTNIRIAPIPEMIPNLAQFLTIKKKAAFADEQKLVDLSAT